MVRNLRKLLSFLLGIIVGLIIICYALIRNIFRRREYKYSGYVDWGDGTITKLSDKEASECVEHLYKEPGEYQVILSGTLEPDLFRNCFDKSKLN